jgi:zinc transport system substrate-binding protein
MNFMNKCSVVLLTVLCCFSCSHTTRQQHTITVTIEPQRYFVEQLVDTCFQVVSMVAPGVSPETYDPSPTQIARLAHSRAYFYMGHLGFEEMWLDKLKKNNPDLPFFDNSRGIHLIVPEDGDTEPAGHDHHAHSGVDPHTWSSPKAALLIVQNMYQDLENIDPARAGVYRANLEKLTHTIHETDSIVQSCLNRSSQKAFIIYHPALTYFARDYGLTQYAIESDGKEPTVEQVRKLVDIAREKGIKTIFIQQEFDRKNAEVIARETGSRLVVINPLSYHWREEMITIAKALSDE